MGWSWEQLQEAPVYVRRYCADFLSLRAEAEAEAAQGDSSAPVDQGDGTRRRVVQHEGW